MMKIKSRRGRIVGVGDDEDDDDDVLSIIPIVHGGLNGGDAIFDTKLPIIETSIRSYTTGSFHCYNTS